MFPAAIAALLLCWGARQDPAAAEPDGSPHLVFSSYLGGSRIDTASDVAVDEEGNSYVAGATASPNFPVTKGTFQSAHADESSGITAVRGLTRGWPADAFVTKLDANGEMVWSTYLGGPSHDRALAVDVDRDGYVYLAGRAGGGFPVTAGAFQTLFRGGNEPSGLGHQDGFVCKLEPDGSAIVFCSYFGTSDPSPVHDLAVDEAGDILIVSSYVSGSYPAAVAKAFRNSPPGGPDAVVAKIAADGSRLIWATFVGGTGAEGPEFSIGVDAAGNPVVAFATQSAGIATRGSYDTSIAGSQDLYLARLTAEGGELAWGSYFGDQEDEPSGAHSLAVEASGTVTVAVPTKSRDLPTTPASFQSRPGKGQKIFVAKLSSDGSRLLASTYLGGGRAERPNGVAVDGEGRVYLAGTTASTNFPVTPDALNKTYGGRRDAITAILSADLRKLRFSSFVGGSDRDLGLAVAVHPTGDRLFSAGTTRSHDWPTLGARASSFAGGESDIALWAFSIGVSSPDAP